MGCNCTAEVNTWLDLQIPNLSDISTCVETDDNVSELDFFTSSLNSSDEVSTESPAHPDPILGNAPQSVSVNSTDAELTKNSALGRLTDSALHFLSPHNKIIKKAARLVATTY